MQDKQAKNLCVYPPLWYGFNGYGYGYAQGYKKSYPYPYSSYPYLHTRRVYPYPCPSLHMAKTPTVQLPGQGPQQLLAVSSAGVHSASGYTANHFSYNTTRQLLASKVYALHRGHVIVVEVQEVHMPIGKTKAQLIRVSLKSK